MAQTLRITLRLARHQAYSYRQDPKVPAFPDDHPVIVYDGVCVLCSRSMRIIARGDRAGRYRYISAQSPLGQALFAHYGLDVGQFETVLLIEAGRAHGKLDAITRISGNLNGVYRTLGVLRVMRVLPGRLQDWCYDAVAKNRYSLFGRTDACIMPDASWRARVIE